MANYIENFSKSLDWAMPFGRTGKFPLDRTDLFSSYVDAVKYAAGNDSDPDSRNLQGTSYVGQIITVYENDVVSVYKIDANRTLSQVGESYKLPIASNDTLGGVKVGAGLTINPETGVLSATGGGVADAVDWKNVTSKPDYLQNPDGKIKTSQLENDSNWVSDESYVHTDNNYSNEEKTKLGSIAEGAQKNVKSDWNEADENSDSFILNKPTKLTDFANDANFIDNTVANLANYYTKTEVSDMLKTVSALDIEVVQSLPSVEDANPNIIYLVAKEYSWEDNTYDEYLFVASTKTFEKIGDTKVDLTNYLQKNGDASNTTVSFEAAATRELPVTGATLAVIVSSIIKNLSDLSNVAFSGDYNDLVNKPTLYPHLVIEQLVLNAGNLSATSMTEFTASTISSVLCRDSVSGEALLVDWHLDASNHFVAEIASAYSNDIEINISYLA